MKISKIRDVKTPIKGTEFSAGIDFFVPFFNNNFKLDLFKKNDNINFIIKYNKEVDKIEEVIKIKPKKRILIPSGIKVNFEDIPKVLIAFNKSGISSKLGLDVLACVIDQDYQGEIHFNFVNTSNKNVFIKEGEKIIQFIMFLISYENIEEIIIDNLYDKETERNKGGFGSTGK